MTVEIGTLVLTGRFGAARDDTPAPREDLEEALNIMRQELLREMDDRLEAVQRRARER